MVARPCLNHRLLFPLAILAGMPFSAAGQIPDAATPAPFLASVTPGGGQRGTTVEISFSGSDLEEPKALIFDHPGITAQAVIPPVPAPMPGKPAPPAPPVTKFQVKIAPDAPLGLHDVRFAGRWGVSQPRIFVVGDLSEVAEKEPNNDLPEAQRVGLDTTINGVVGGGTDVDYLVFKGSRGQKVYAGCLTAGIDSRLTPLLELFDTNGRNLASARPLPEADTAIRVTLPADGDYYLRLASFTYQRGGPNHFYRLNLTTTPWVEALVPPAVSPGGGQITPLGPEVPGAPLSVQVPPDMESRGGPGGFGVFASNRLRFPMMVPPGLKPAPVPPPFLGVTSLKILAEKEPNDTPAQAQEVGVGTDIHGTIGKRADADWFRVRLRKEQQVVLTVLGDAIGSMADLTLNARLGPEGNDLADLDDQPAGGPVPRMLTRGDDPPSHAITAGADGEYFIRVGSRLSDSAWGQRHFYRLQVAVPRPRFGAVALVGDLYRPTGLLVPKGALGTVVVGVFREDGFSGEVTVTAEGLPPHVSSPPLVIPSGATSGRMIFQAQAQAPLDPKAISLVARGAVNGQAQAKAVVPVGYVWPVGANNNNIVPPARAHQALYLACVDGAPFSLVASLEKTALVQGEKGQVKVAIKRSGADAKYPVNVQTLDLPANFVNNNQAVAVAADKSEGALGITVPPGMPPGPQVILVRGQGAVPFSKDPMAKQKPNTSAVAWAAPVTLLVLPKSLAKLGIPVPQVPVKVGQSAEVVVQVSRENGYGGPFHVDLTVPPGEAPGLQVGPAACPAGGTEVRIPVRANPGAKPGLRKDIAVKLTGTWPGGQPIPVTAKFSVLINP